MAHKRPCRTHKALRMVRGSPAISTAVHPSPTPRLACNMLHVSCTLVAHVGPAVQSCSKTLSVIVAAGMTGWQHVHCIDPISPVSHVCGVVPQDFDRMCQHSFELSRAAVICQHDGMLSCNPNCQMSERVWWQLEMSWQSTGSCRLGPCSGVKFTPPLPSLHAMGVVQH